LQQLLKFAKIFINTQIFATDDEDSTGWFEKGRREKVQRCESSVDESVDGIGGEGAEILGC
jgi:hypothetical protein